MLTNDVTLFFDMARDWIKANIALCLGVGGLLILAGAGGYGYYYFARQHEQQAHTVLHDCYEQYEQALQGKANWADVTAMVCAGHKKFRNTRIGPYLLAIEIDALLQQQKLSEASEKLSAMLTSLNSSSPLYPLYKLKRALVYIDYYANDAVSREKVVSQLEALAHDSGNIYADAAQYYLGLYYQSSGDSQKAREVWKPLSALNDGIADRMGQSPWAAMAQEKLNGLPG
jgi:predicted negative regulator of RcsB-dependent stress response